MTNTKINQSLEFHANKHTYIVGWDVGGAHLKAGLFQVDTINKTSQLLEVKQVPCALWQGLSQLTIAIQCIWDAMAQSVPTLNQTLVKTQIQHFITMTGELVDIFEHRLQGVTQISQLMQSVLLGDHWFYVMQDDAKKPQFIKLKANTSEDYVEHWQSIASANWHASAALIAKVVQHALFVDIGSTTSDFTVIKYHKVQANAFTDGARMRAHTLVYTGVVRTSVMSIGQNVAFDGAMTSVAAEHFATSADIYRLTADLIEANDMSDTADGAEKTLEASAKRLARMVGCDASEHDFKTWQALAQGFKMLQFERLLAVADLHLKAHFSDKDPMPIIIGAGVGSFLVKEIAQALGLPFTAVEDYFNALEDSAASPWQGQAQMCVSLPAVAVGLLGVAFLMHHDRECEDGHGS